MLTISSRDQPHLLDTITRTLTKHVTRIVDADVLTSLDGSVSGTSEAVDTFMCLL